MAAMHLRCGDVTTLNRPGVEGSSRGVALTAMSDDPESRTPMLMDESGASW